MVLTVHHLGHSQSDRIVWLCEELGLDYELKKYDRSPVMSPPDYVALHPLGAAPVIWDGNDDQNKIVLAESGACAEYIVATHGQGRLSVAPGRPGYADYLYWFHLANGTLQPALGRSMSLRSAGAGQDSIIAQRNNEKLKQLFGMIDARLGEKAWLAGDEFTAADIMSVFCFTGMREFYAYDLSEYGNILAWLQRVAAREGYQRAMAKGDADVDYSALMKGPAPPPFKGIAAMMKK